MKLVMNNLGKFFVVAIAAALMLAFISASLLPSLRTFVSNVFIDETNYVEKGNQLSAPILKSEHSVVTVSVGEEVDIFESIVATSQSGENLITQLSDDYARQNRDRRHVFVYRIDSDNSHYLTDSIDTSHPGNWAVLYLLKDGSDSAILKVSYKVM